jgi:hypothetical protein
MDSPSFANSSERFANNFASDMTRGVLLPKDDYRDIVTPSIEWGFERVFDHRIGKKTLRDALEEAAFISRGESHQVLMEEFSNFLGRTKLEDKDDWFLHAMRETITALMANPACTGGSSELKAALRKVNGLQRSRS